MKFYNHMIDLRSNDYPAYFTLLLGNRRIQRLLAPLFCLQVELKKIPLQAPLLPGLMRLRWWQDQMLSSSKDNKSAPFLHDLAHLPQPEILSIIQGYEFLLEEPIHNTNNVLQLAQRTEIPFLTLATQLIGDIPFTKDDEAVIHSLGLGLTASYIYLQRSNLQAKGIQIFLSNDELQRLITENLPPYFTRKTRWLAPFSGFLTALNQEFKNQRKPSLLHLQWAMVKAYFKNLFSLRKTASLI